MELSSQHAQLLDSYVRMVGQRTRQLHVKEFELAIEEFTESQVPQGELLNEEEIKSLVSDLKSEVTIHRLLKSRVCAHVAGNIWRSQVCMKTVLFCPPGVGKFAQSQGGPTGLTAGYA